MDIIDYVKCSSDKIMSPYNINNADILVLTALSYVDFSVVTDNFNKKIKLYDAINQLFAFGINNKYQDFLLRLKNSKRFSELYLLGYRNEYDSLNNPTQFSVITIQISESLFFVSYSGTDGTIVGWKEDFQFSYLPQTPAQVKALKYLEEAANSLRGNFIISGHSKGGNLAAYAAIFSYSNIRKRINSVFLNDAPGFNKNVDILIQNGYIELSDRIFCIVPQNSFIGQLLQVLPDKHFKVIYSNSDKLIYQHDIFTWQTTDFGEPIWAERNKSTCQVMEKINQLIGRLNMKQREKLTNCIFDALENHNIRNVDSLKNFIPVEFLPFYH